MSDPFHPIPLPKGLTEDDMIDLVDGKLPAEREGLVLAALKAEPRLALLVKQMREDRSGVELVPSAAAGVPMDLADRIEARLQSEAIRQLAAQEAQTHAAAVPTSSIVTIRQRDHGGWRAVLESPWTRRFATAASLAIVAGAGYLGYREYQGLQAKERERIAARERQAELDRLALATAAKPDAGDAPVGEPTETIAAAPPGPIEPDVAVLAIAEPLTSERALELAQEGRLVISVRLASAGPGSFERVQAIAKAAGREGGWREVELVHTPAAYAMLLTPSIDAPAPIVGPSVPAPTFASTTDPHAVPTPAPAPQPWSALRPVVKAIYAVELAPRSQTLTGLLDALSPGRPDGAVFRVLETPLKSDLPMTPEDVLWWQNPPATWGQKVKVPVVVEGLE